MTDVGNEFPLLSAIETASDGTALVAHALLDPQSDPFLADHQYKGAPILPAAAILELFAQATLAFSPQQRVAGFSAVRFHLGLRLFQQRSESVRIVVTPLGPSRVTCQLRHDFQNSRGMVVDANRLYATGIVELEPRGAEPYAVVPLPPDEAMKNVNYVDDARMWFGPGMRCLQKLTWQGTTGSGEIIADSLLGLGGRQGDRWCLSPAVFDASLVGCAVYMAETGSALQMPNEMESIRLGTRFAHAGERCRIAFRFLGLQNGRSVFEWSLFGAGGAILCTATGYHCDLVVGKPGECLLGARV